VPIPKLLRPSNNARRRKFMIDSIWSDCDGFCHCLRT
jgi:hypothetical protein